MGFILGCLGAPSQHNRQIPSMSISREQDGSACHFYAGSLKLPSLYPLAKAVRKIPSGARERDSNSALRWCCQGQSSTRAHGMETSFLLSFKSTIFHPILHTKVPIYLSSALQVTESSVLQPYIPQHCFLCLTHNKCPICAYWMRSSLFLKHLSHVSLKRAFES